MWYTCVLLCLLHICVGSKILVVFPAPSRSHVMLGDSLVNILLDAGHEVTYVTSNSSLPSNELLTIVDISSAVSNPTKREVLNLMELVRNPRPPQQVLEVGTNFAKRALEHNAVKEMLHDTNLSFDVVVAEWFFTGLLAPLGSLYNCPLIWYSALVASWMNLQLVEGQTNSAYVADLQARHLATATGLRDRLDRLRHQVYVTGWTYYMTYYVEANAYLEIYRTPLQLRGRYPPSYEDLVYNASMLLINAHPLLGQTLALPANAKYVGGHHIKVPTKPLAQDLQQLLDKSKNGVIFFSLGSNIKSKDLPENMKLQLLQVFGQLEQTVIWKFEELLEDLPTNVHIVQWAPQTSILNHTNTLMFITHGGFLSCMESTYFGVPIIAIPVFGDQFLNTALAASRGHGIRVDFTDNLPYKVKDAIHEILRNDSYRRSSQKGSAILQNPLVSPQKEVLYWIELVTNHGAEHLRSPALHLTTFEKHHLDSLAVIIMLIWFLSKVWKVIKVHWNSETETSPGPEHDKKAL